MTEHGNPVHPITSTDPVFISYRQSDGTAITTELAWLLRAAGIPVWRDHDDLPPGDTEARLRQAIADGLSGAVLVITRDVTHSDVVKFVEAPALLDLHNHEPAFALAITNSVERAPGKLDYTAPDTVLGQRPGTLTGVDQNPSDRPGLIALTRELLWHRLAQQRTHVAASDRTLTLTIQTRNQAQVYDRTGSELDIRIRPSTHDRLPNPDGLQDLADVITLIPDAVTRTSANRVHVEGGAHLSVAFALGAALSSTRVGHIDVVDQYGSTWTSGSEARRPLTPRFTVITDGNNPTPSPGKPRVAVYLDLLPRRSDAAFDRYLEEHQADLAAWQHLRPMTNELLDPTLAGEYAAEIAAQIRDLCDSSTNAEVQLLLRCPFPIAVLTGRLANTLRLVLYEWDNTDPDSGTDFRPRYVPTISINPSRPAGVITAVHRTT